MTDQESGLVSAVKRHINIWAAILIVLGLIVHIATLNWLLGKMCSCSNFKAEVSGNHTTTNVNLPNESPVDQRAREILIKKGMIDASRLSESLSVKRSP